MTFYVPPPGMPATMDDRHPGAWIAPCIATVITVIVAPFAFTVLMLSPMACDSCSQAGQDRFGVLFWSFAVGLLIPVALLVISWCLPWRREYLAARITLAAFAPGSLIGMLLLFIQLLDSVH
ncbi:hypothetical protein ACWC2K_04990 [Streptomyces chattanoogensis]